jgi:hypothetical protein
MSDTEPTNEETDVVEDTPGHVAGNPEPPYDFPVPEKYADTPFDELPEGLQDRLRRLEEAQAPNIGGSDTTTGGSVDPAIAPPDTAGSP